MLDCRTEEGARNFGGRVRGMIRFGMSYSIRFGIRGRIKNRIREKNLGKIRVRFMVMNGIKIMQQDRTVRMESTLGGNGL